MCTLDTLTWTLLRLSEIPERFFLASYHFSQPQFEVHAFSDLSEDPLIFSNIVSCDDLHSFSISHCTASWLVILTLRKKPAPLRRSEESGMLK